MKKTIKKCIKKDDDFFETGEFIVKSNALVEARYRLSLQESQVVLWLLTQIRTEDEDFKIHKLKIADFAKIVGVRVDGKYDEMQQITERLMKRIVKIYEPEKKEYLQVAWLSSARYQTDKGYVLLEFSPQLKPYLLQLKSHFTKIEITDTLKIKSVYAIRIFELLLQYFNIGKRTNSLEEMRGYLGIKDHEYKKYCDLKRKVIERAKTEINTKTNYDVNYDEIKTSRKVTAIEWEIKKKPKSSKLLSLEQEATRSQFLLESLLSYGFSNATAKRLIGNNEESVIKNAIKAVDLQVARGNVKNPKAMIQTAIKDQWHPEVFKTRKQKS